MIERYNAGISDDFGNIHFYELDGGVWVKFEDHEREVKELERRILWLETRMMNAYELECFGNDDCLSIIGMLLEFEPRNASNSHVRYMRPIAVKPTPEYFEND